jgi:hypothetical protein
MMIYGISLNLRSNWVVRNFLFIFYIIWIFVFRIIIYITFCFLKHFAASLSPRPQILIFLSCCSLTINSVDNSDFFVHYCWKKEEKREQAKQILAFIIKTKNAKRVVTGGISLATFNIELKNKCRNKKSYLWFILSFVTFMKNWTIISCTLVLKILIHNQVQ